MIGLKEYYHKAEVGKVGIRGNNPKQLKQVSLQHRPEHDAKRLICFARSQILCLCFMVEIQKEVQRAAPETVSFGPYDRMLLCYDNAQYL